MPYGASMLARPLEVFIRDMAEHPSSIVDLGIGYGFWGAFYRNYFNGRKDGRMAKPFPVRMDGVEGFSGYEGPMWDLYDNIYRFNIEHIALQHFLPKYDLTICIDVLEHLTRATGESILQNSRSAFIGVCQAMYDEKQAPFGNVLEDHITMWTEADLQRHGFNVSRINDAYLLATKSKS